jgi:hypothetical protein
MEDFQEPVALTRGGIARALSWVTTKTRESLSLWSWDSLHSSRFFDILLADHIGYAPLNEDRDTIYGQPHDEEGAIGARSSRGGISPPPNH